MIFNLDASCGSFIGNGRDTNQDNFYFNKKHLPVNNKGLKNPLKYTGTTTDNLLFAVFDGMGGEVKGEEAACKACETFASEFKQLEEIALSGKEFFLKACQKANEEVNYLSKEMKIETMGTTVAALYFTQDEVVACNIGDSKIFRVRDNQMMQISEDHTDEKIMASIGVRKKPVLLQYIGISETEMSIEPFIARGDVQKDDVFVICSDGVTEVLSADIIYDFVKNNDAEEAVRQLLAEIDLKGGSDNSTVIVIKVCK